MICPLCPELRRELSRLRQRLQVDARVASIALTVEPMPDALRDALRDRSRWPNPHDVTARTAEAYRRVELETVASVVSKMHMVSKGDRKALVAFEWSEFRAMCEAMERLDGARLRGGGDAQP